ncbi:MAG: hypothetical protein ACLFP2_00765 [Candidatus Woesearchaeota archaeon]
MKINEKDYIVETDAEAIAHGCNAKGVMGKGAAFGISRFYSIDMYLDYKNKCELGFFKPGGVYSYEESGKPILYNLGIQNKPGKNAKMHHISGCLEKLAKNMEEKGISFLAITPLGCHNGGLNMEEVLDSIGYHLSGFDVTVYTAKDQIPLNLPETPHNVIRVFF